MPNLNNFKKRIKSVNARILNTRKRYGDDSQIVRRIDATLSRIYKDESVKYYKIPKNANLRQLNLIERGLEKIENSLYTSKSGREELVRKTKESFKSNEFFKDMPDENIEQLWDLFETDVWPKVRELIMPESDLVIDTIAGNLISGASIDSIEDILNEYIESENKDSSINDFIKEKIKKRK